MSLNAPQQQQQDDTTVPKTTTEYIKNLRICVEEALAKIDAVEHSITTTTTHDLETHMNEYTKALESLYASSLEKQEEDVEVPLELVQYLDNGGNPDECMRYIMSAVLRNSQDVHGKKHAIEVLSSMMHNR